MPALPSRSSATGEALGALLDWGALQVVGFLSLAVLTAALVRAGGCSQVAETGAVRWFAPQRATLLLEPAPCGAAVEVDGVLHCDGDDLPFRRHVAVGRRVDARGHVVGDGWLPGAAFSALSLPVDLASADVERLASLPGIGPARAAEIVAARPIASLDALSRIRGIGPATVTRIAGRGRLGPTLRSPPP